MKRFVKEYANWRYKEFYNLLTIQHNEGVRIALNKCMEKILKLQRLYERGYITTDEVMKALAKITTDDYINNNVDVIMKEVIA